MRTHSFFYARELFKWGLIWFSILISGSVKTTGTYVTKYWSRAYPKKLLIQRIWTLYLLLQEILNFKFELLSLSPRIAQCYSTILTILFFRAVFSELLIVVFGFGVPCFIEIELGVYSFYLLSFRLHFELFLVKQSKLLVKIK